MRNGVVTDTDGTQIWYRNGKIHRENDLPAIIRQENQYWWYNNEWHREDGPATISDDGIAWCLNNVQYNFDDWCDLLDKSPKEKAFLMLKYL